MKTEKYKLIDKYKIYFLFEGAWKHVGGSGYDTETQASMACLVLEAIHNPLDSIIKREPFIFKKEKRS